ncbi:UDP-N-acetylmuramoyl-tripeptide--D-alanyl-D-alanine ligase (plasmid) [Streptomyces sp. NBC_00080]|uniref:UDP-N-acetylmuramoyl-tripeptide--D-alanyl-D- alanine ligase n=1 Tax=unclassified Streptomyces TaxID=2593676 RepID=UPI001154D2FF|nr:UDP-N-acetylmuramoyl-tripeptide--D-alanyl-D-alanine ligase [Streptomyces sp. SLBN-115]TQJ37966.1 UDP-N-acetylmuramoyl-tripeptide--D-alanyl-D-alanine ligase [Streptomyces sp. SLBN-115]
MSLTAIADIVGGRLTDVLDPEAQVTQPAVFDSREAVEGTLFIALKGQHTDGHTYAQAAVDKGAAAALVTRPVGVPAIVVDDVLAAFGQLGRTLLHSVFGGAHVVAITGSAGKTSTKDFIAQVLPGPVVATPESFNNEIGLPLTITLADPATRFLVLEMGARHIGDIRALTRIAQPDISVVTNVGTAHVGEFGSRENIATAKGEIVEALPQGGLAVLNADDDFVQEMQNRTQGRVVTYGLSEAAVIRAVDVTVDDRGRASYVLVTPEGYADVRLQFVGDVQVHNSLAAIAHGATVSRDAPNDPAPSLNGIREESGKRGCSPRRRGRRRAAERRPACRRTARGAPRLLRIRGIHPCPPHVLVVQERDGRQSCGTAVRHGR